MRSDKLDFLRPADHIPGPKQGSWTYDSYAALPDDGRRYEIVAGVLYMAPAPSDEHQNAATLISYYLVHHVQIAGLGKVRSTPYAVKLNASTVVEPDVVVVLKEHLSVITSKGVVGTPDLAVEIASPSTSTYDRQQKFLAYQKAGVPEYWLVDPIAYTVEVWTLEESKYQMLGIFKGKASIPSKIVPTIAEVHVEQFFA